jgi:hypothetical protein
LDNREAAECWVSGGADFDSLDEVDKQRLMMFEAGVLGAWYHTFQLRQQGLITDQTWNEQPFAFKYFGRRQDVRATWSFARDGVEREFQDLRADTWNRCLFQVRS